MGTAYTPGLKVSPFTTIRKSRRLPLKGEVVVAEGQEVMPDTVVARTLIPGILRTVAGSPDEPISEATLRDEHRGQIVVGGSNISGGALRRAAELGVTGIVVGAIIDRDLIDFLGYDIGVAITGHERIPLTLVIT